MPALFVGVLWVVLLGWQVVDSRAETGRHRAALEEMGVACVRTLEAAIRSLGRGRRQRPEFLRAILEEVTTVRGIRGVRLTDLEGGEVVSVGEERPALHPASFSGALWTKTELVVGRRVDIGECPVDGHGRPRPQAAIAEPLYLFLALDTSHVDRELASDLWMRLVVQSVATAAALGALLLLLSQERARALREELAIAEERTRQHREWATLGAGLAHETKNPLSVIRGIAQRLADGDTGERAERAAEIVDEADRVVARINEFLTFSRPLEPSPESVDLCSLLSEMARLIGPDLEPKDATVSAQCDTVSIHADRNMLRQILLNLLVNAARAIPRGGQICLSAAKEAEGRVRLEVTDNGAGIPAEELERIFEPYFSRTPGGTGLGLAIVRRLAELQGWAIDVNSKPGTGTTFRIRGIKA